MIGVSTASNRCVRPFEYLKLQEQTGFTVPVAETHVRMERFQFLAQPMLELKKIQGKTPQQVWAMFDADVDRQVFYFNKRFLPGYGTQR